MGEFIVIIHKKKYTLKRTNKLSVWLQVLHKTSDMELPGQYIFHNGWKKFRLREVSTVDATIHKTGKASLLQAEAAGSPGTAPSEGPLPRYCHPNQADKIAEVGTYWPQLPIWNWL